MHDAVPNALAEKACLPGCVTSVEDHGYLLLFSIQVRPAGAACLWAAASPIALALRAVHGPKPCKHGVCASPCGSSGGEHAGRDGLPASRACQTLPAHRNNCVCSCSQDPSGAVGSQGVTGFLPFTEETEADGQQRHDLAVGQTLDVVITQARDRRLVHASALPARVAAAATSDWPDSSIGGPPCSPPPPHIHPAGRIVAGASAIHCCICGHLRLARLQHRRAPPARWARRRGCERFQLLHPVAAACLHACRRTRHAAACGPEYEVLAMCRMSVWKGVDLSPRIRASSMRASALLGQQSPVRAGGLLPGMLVQARVRSCTTGGVLVSFLTFFSGTVDVFHLQQVPGCRKAIQPGPAAAHEGTQAFRPLGRALVSNDALAFNKGWCMTLGLVRSRQPFQRLVCQRLFGKTHQGCCHARCHLPHIMPALHLRCCSTWGP